MLGRFLRSLGAPSPTTGNSAATKMRTLYNWRCECGAKSRGGASSQSDAEYLALRHQMREAGHPMPTVYTTQVEVPADWPW